MDSDITRIISAIIFYAIIQLTMITYKKQKLKNLNKKIEEEKENGKKITNMQNKK